MKKLFTLLVSSLVSLASMAQTTDYKCALAVLVNGAQKLHPLYSGSGYACRYHHRA